MKYSIFVHAMTYCTDGSLKHKSSGNQTAFITSSHPLYPSSTKLQANFPPLSSERWQLTGVNTTEMWYLKGNRKIFLIMIIALLTLMATHGSNCDLSNYPLSEHVNIFISSFIPWFICYFTTRKLMG